MYGHSSGDIERSSRETQNIICISLNKKKDELYMTEEVIDTLVGLAGFARLQ